jgi:hypothetical protein
MVLKQLILVFVLLQTATLKHMQEKHVNIDDIRLFQKSISYPYIATDKREAVIIDNMNRLEKGMSIYQVVEILTEPDEVNPTYKAVKSKSGNNIVGFSVVYILKRAQNTGSVNNKAEKLIRIHFNITGDLISAHAVDIDGFEVIER